MNAHTYIRDFQQRKKIRDLIPQVQNLNLPTAVLHTIFILLVIFNFNRRFWHRTYKYSKNCKLKARLSKTQANSLEGKLRVTDELTDISSRFIKAIQLYIQKRLKPLWILNFLAHGFLTFQEACVVYLSSTTKKKMFSSYRSYKKYCLYMQVLFRMSGNRIYVSHMTTLYVLFVVTIPSIIIFSRLWKRFCSCFRNT